MSTTIRFLTVQSWVVECSWRKLYNQAYCFYFNLITLCLKWALNTTWQFFNVSPLSSVPNIWDDCFICYPLLSYLNSLTHLLLIVPPHILLWQRTSPDVEFLMAWSANLTYVTTDLAFSLLLYLRNVNIITSQVLRFHFNFFQALYSHF